MALVQNAVLGELSGKMGNKVFRKMNGKTFVSERPLHYEPAKTPVARKVRSSFGITVHLAKKIISDTTLKEVWKAARIEGSTSYHRIIKHNSKLVNEGSLTERSKITPDGLFLNVDSASMENQMLHLTLNCPDEGGLIFPAKLTILYYFRKAGIPLVLTQVTIPESITGGIYELDLKPGKSIIRLFTEYPDVLILTALVSETSQKKKIYWTSTAASRLD